MTPDELYKKGYSDGAGGAAANPTYAEETNYRQGYLDGQADKDGGEVERGTKSAHIEAEFPQHNQPPAGYRWTGEYRTPAKGEIYYTKAGNAGVAKDHPRNNRKRHLLLPVNSCWRVRCNFADGHKGQCSDRQLKP